MSEIAVYLDNMVVAAEKIGIRAKKHLNPGLSAARVEKLAAALPFALPGDILDFYRWRDGMRLEGQSYEFQLIPGLVFEPMEHAVERTLELISIAGNPAVRWSRTWYSLCTDLGGDYLALKANSDSSFGEIIAINTADTPYPAFRSFRSMLIAVADCYTFGAYSLDEEGFLIEDGWLSDAIYRVHNGGWSPVLLPDPEELKLAARRAREIFVDAGRKDLLEKLADLERRSGLH